MTRPIQDGTMLFNIGRTTGFTTGRFTGLRSVLLLPSGEVDANGEPVEHETREHSLTGFNDREFANRGDSGAVVFDEAGMIVGLLFGSNDQTKGHLFHALVETRGGYQKDN